MKGVFRVKEQKKISLESLVSETKKMEELGSLGKFLRQKKIIIFMIQELEKLPN